MNTKNVLRAALAVALVSCAPSRGGRAELRDVACDCFAPAGAAARRTLVIHDFAFPWSAKRAPRTEFHAHVAEGRFCFSFVAEDRDLVVSGEWRGESTLDGEDRVEVFFARDAALERYYCIEVDPLGRVHDYAARHYRKFDPAWNCPGLRTTGVRTEDGYRVTGSFPLETLASMLGRPVASGLTIRVGLFRAEFYGRGATARGEAADNWLSWILPGSGTPDFHIPSAFADLTLP